MAEQVVNKTDHEKRITRTQSMQNMLVNIHEFGFNAIAKSEHTNIKDPFQSTYENKDENGFVVLKPLYDPLSLMRLVEMSDILGQCIAAMATNIDGLGWEYVRIDDPTEATDLPAEAKQEKEKLELFLNYVNDRDDFTKVRKRHRFNMEACGYGAIEVVRNRTGDIIELYNIPSHVLRMTKPDEDFTDFEEQIRGTDGKFLPFQRKRKFRRFVQLLNGSKKVFFKEFGDPRAISLTTGREGPSGEEDYANEILFTTIYSPYTPYGLPRWIGNLMALMGSRKAEEINYLFFDNKTIPPLIIMVSGGALTGEAVDRLENLFEKELKGVENFHKALLLEATPHSATDIPGEKISPVRITVQPLTTFIQKDALFMEYRKSARNAIRSSFELPPIYTGDTTDYTRATAFESARVAEEQVFEPARRDWDYMFNRMIIPAMSVNFWNLKSLGVKTKDDTEIVKAMGMVKEAITVAAIQEAVAEMRNVPKGQIDPKMYETPLALLTSMPNEPPPEENGPLQEKIKQIEKRLQDIVDREFNRGD